MEVAVFEGGGPIWPKISGRRGHPPLSILFVHDYPVNQHTSGRHRPTSSTSTLRRRPVSGCYVRPTSCRHRKPPPFETGDVEQSLSSRKRRMKCTNALSTKAVVHVTIRTSRVVTVRHFYRATMRSIYARYCCRDSVCPSVFLSVCQTRVL